jgi:DNA-binding NarL/FixJ family response regulator
VQLTLSPLSAGEGGTCCAVVFDLRERNAHAQAQLISELLDVSRIVAGKLHLSAAYALEQRGARVDTAQSAAAALEKLAAGRYDVLLSDLGLPDPPRSRGPSRSC